MTETNQVLILSTHTVRASSPTNQEHHRHTIPLTPWDLKRICLNYIQKGMLFPKPYQPISIPTLISSFSAALDIFFPLAGRLTTIHHDTTPPSLSINLICTNDGANFIHASAAHITASDILTPLHIPTIINSFFPLNGSIGIDGHTSPLIAVQVTEIADAVFIACSVNHTAADGTSFWHFINCWSEIAKSGSSSTSHSPFLDRGFLDTPLPISLPYSTHNDFIKRPVFTPVTECFFNFTASSIASLKSKANAEMGASASSKTISSLQALLAHTWRCVTKARGLEPDEETMYEMLVGCRSRLSPPLPQAYFGNASVKVAAKSIAGELVGRGVGWAASLLNQAIATQSVEVVRESVEGWRADPSFSYVVGSGRSRHLLTGSSPRFDMYGNDFGWGSPVAVRSGCGNKRDGEVTVFPGIERGSMGLGVCLSPEAVSALVEDEVFMEAVNYKRYHDELSHFSFC